MIGCAGDRVPVTLALIVVTLLLTAVLSVLLGVTAAVRGGWVDRVLQFVSVLGTAVPAFIIAIALVFALRHPLAASSRPPATSPRT